MHPKRAEYQVQTAKRFLLWLALAFACFLSASAIPQPAPENRVWGIFSIGYDAPVTETTDLINRAETSTSNYDTAPIHRATTEEMTTGANRALFGQIGDGAGSLGRAGINELKDAAAQFGSQRGASQVIIQGGTRTSGRLSGTTPRPIVIPTQ